VVTFCDPVKTPVPTTESSSGSVVVLELDGEFGGVLGGEFGGVDAPAGPVSAAFAEPESESAEVLESDAVVVSSAHAMPGLLAIAPVTPRATASAPTLPMYLAYTEAVRGPEAVGSGGGVIEEDWPPNSVQFQSLDGIEVTPQGIIELARRRK
jgi:hypothetical protein